MERDRRVLSHLSGGNMPIQINGLELKRVQRFLTEADRYIPVDSDWVEVMAIELAQSRPDVLRLETLLLALLADGFISDGEPERDDACEDPKISYGSTKMVRQVAWV